MHRYLLALGIMLLSGCLSALNLAFPDGSEFAISGDSLRQIPMVRFSTLRSAEGEMANESWEGIPLLQLVEKTQQPWDVMLITSKDGYQTTANRAEMNPQSAMLALNKGDAPLSDYDIRVIFPQGHESTWVRNIDKIKLELLQNIAPRRFYPWRALAEACGQPDPDRVVLCFKEIAERAYSLNKADFIFIAADGAKLTFNYPKQLKSYSLLIQANGKNAWLQQEGKSNTQTARELIYMQYGPLAYGDPGALNAISESLGWGGNLITKSITRGVVQSAAPSNISDLAPGCWIELDR